VFAALLGGTQGENGTVRGVLSNAWMGNAVEEVVWGALCAALDAFGSVDIVVNNAGIIRDVSFAKMSSEACESVLDVHLNGAYAVTRAAWPHMRDKGYGRIVMISSAAGLYGNFGQANYAAAKLGLVGLTRTLAAEGRSRNILVNCLAPIAASRIMATVMPEDLLAALQPELVAPVVAWLCHEECTSSGLVLEAGGGWIGRLRLERAKGAFFPHAVTDAARLSAAGGGGVATTDLEFTPEMVRERWSEIADFRDPDFPTSNQDAIALLMSALDSEEVRQLRDAARGAKPKL